MNYLNLNWLLSRLLEKCGVKTYTERCEFAAHFFAGCTFTLAGILWSWWIVVGWIFWTFVDEFVFDGWKGSDTIWDLASKLAGPMIYGVWKLWTIAV